MKPTMDSNEKKAIWGWVMYDFANSAFTTLIVTFIYATYFTKAIAPNPIDGTILWGRAISLSALLVAFLSPMLGMYGDRTNQRKKMLFLATLLAAICSAMLYTSLPGQVFQALFWFTLGNIAFELGMVFYNSFLPDIAPTDKTGRVSGLGWGVGYCGGLFALLIALFGFVNPEVPWFGLSKETGQHIRATNVLVALWFLLFSLPFFFFVREKKVLIKPYRPTARGWWLKQIKEDLYQHPQTIRFLLARLLYNDGLITVFAFGGIYAAGTFDFSFKDILLFGIVLNVAAGVGAFLFGFLDDWLGSRNTIIFSLLGLGMAALLAILTSSTELFWLAGICIGLFAGPNQSASRSFMTKLTPPEKEGEFFGYFALSGKLTAFLGPFLLSILTTIFESQRVGMSIVLVLFVSGGVVLCQVKTP